MLTLLPLAGFQDAFRRRNSKTMDQFGDRRGSISVYDNYSLPSSKSSMRRFSSYEELAPFFQQILAQEKPLPTASPLVKARRGSVTAVLKGSFKRRKSVTASTIADSATEASCDDLDAQLARIKNQLVSYCAAVNSACARIFLLLHFLALYTYTPNHPPPSLSYHFRLNSKVKTLICHRE